MAVRFLIFATLISLAGLLSAQTATPALQETTSSSYSNARSVAGTWAGDLKALTLTPVQWDRDQWGRVGEIALGIGVVGAFDHDINRAFLRNRSQASDDVSKVVTPFGGGRALQLSVGMVAAGLIFRNTSLRDTGLDAFEAEIIAAGVITPVIKRIAGRDRPIAETGASDFDPGTKQQSFPSGHATNAFALASVVAARSNGWLVPTLAYTVACSVAVSRMNDRAHFASDVVTGALIGRGIGRAIVRRHQRTGGRVESLSIVPMVTPVSRGIGVKLTLR